MAYCKDEFKTGYWFTFVLVFMHGVHWLISLITKWVGKYECFVTLFLWLLFCFFSLWFMQWDWQCNDAFLGQWLSFRFFATLLPFYVFGNIVQHYNSAFFQIEKYHISYLLALVIFILIFFQESIGLCRGLVLCFVGVVFLYSFFYRNLILFSSANYVGLFLSFIGRHTLPIYLIHFFILKGMQMHFVLDLLDVNSQWVWLTLIASFVALLAILLSVGVRYLFGFSWIANILFGK